MKPKKIGDIAIGIVEAHELEKNLKLVGFDAMSRKGYFLVPRYLFDLKISAEAKFVYATLLSYAWNKDYSFPGQDTIAKDLSLSRDTIIRRIKELKDHKLLRVTRRGQGKPNIYHLYLPKYLK